MSLTKHISSILTEQISDKKREALMKLLKNVVNFDKWEFSNNEEKINIYLNILIDIDPTPNNQYTSWLIKNIIPTDYKSRSVGFIDDTDWHRLVDDREEIRDLIQVHFEKKQSSEFPSQYKDINKIKSISDLRKVLNKYLFSLQDATFDEVLERSDAKQGEDYELIIEDSDVRIYIPLTQKGACALGGKSDWCTTYGEYSMNPRYKNRTHNAFDNYKRDGNLYVIYSTNDEQLYQIHFGRSEFMDSENDSVNFEQIFDYVSEDTKNKFARIVFNNGDVNENNIRDIVTLIFDNLHDMVRTYAHPNDGEFIEMFEDDVHWSEYIHDNDILKYDGWTEEGFGLIRDYCIDSEFVTEEEINEMSNQELLEFIERQQSHNIIGEIRYALQYAIEQLKHEAKRELFKPYVLDTLAMNMGFDGYEELKEYMVERMDGTIVVSRESKYENLSDFDLLKEIVYANIGTDAYEYAIVDVPRNVLYEEPTINWEDSYDTLKNYLSEYAIR
jgi:hypothetical protein